MRVSPIQKKSEETIIQRTLDICKKINQDYPLDAIVIACNTASTVVLPPLREQFSIPIVGTVPAIQACSRNLTNETYWAVGDKGHS